MELPSILYVDDETINLELLQLTFMNDFQVITASSAQEGLDLLEKHPGIHVVVSDLKMPVMNGLDFIKIVKQQYPSKVCMLLTGYMEYLGPMRLTEVEEVQRRIVEKFRSEPVSDDAFV